MSITENFRHFYKDLQTFPNHLIDQQPILHVLLQNYVTFVSFEVFTTIDTTPSELEWIKSVWISSECTRKTETECARAKWFCLATWDISSTTHTHINNPHADVGRATGKEKEEEKSFEPPNVFHFLYRMWGEEGKIRCKSKPLDTFFSKTITI